MFELTDSELLAVKAFRKREVDLERLFEAIFKEKPVECLLKPRDFEDSHMRLIDSFFEFEEESELTTLHTYELYCNEAARVKTEPLNQVHFGRVLQEVFPGICRTIKTKNGIRYNVYRCIRVKNYGSQVS